MIISVAIPEPDDHKGISTQALSTSAPLLGWTAATDQPETGPDHCLGWQSSSILSHSEKNRRNDPKTMGR